MKKEMPQLYATVLSIIKGYDKKFITYDQIIERLGQDEKFRRKLNKIVVELIEDYGYPIGTSSREGTKGCFYCNSEEDVNLALSTLTSRSDKLLKRAAALKEAKKVHIG